MFWIPGTFLPKIVSGNKITGNKVVQKIYPKKKKREKSPKSWEKDFLYEILLEPEKKS